MAQLVVAAAGAAIGGALAPGVVALGMTGASLGWMAGSLVGSMFAPAQKSEGPRLGDLSVSGSSYGTPNPWVAGSPRVSGQVVWASAKREIATTQSAGGKGGGGAEYTSYTYEVDLLLMLSDNEIAGVSRVWSTGELVYDGNVKAGLWSRMTVYGGAASQLPDPDYEAAVGTANAPAYRGRGTVFIKSLQLGSGGSLPNLTFEIGTSGVGLDAGRASVLAAGWISINANGGWDAYDISKTSAPTWDSYFGEFGANALLYKKTYTVATAPGDSTPDYTSITKILPIDTAFKYRIYHNNSTVAGDQANIDLEFLDASHNVVVCFGLHSYSLTGRHYVTYGTTSPPSNTLRFDYVSNAEISFAAGYVGWFDIGTWGANPNLTIACAGLSVKFVRITLGRLFEQYTVSSDGAAWSIFQKIPLVGADSYYASSYNHIQGVCNKLLLKAGLTDSQFDTSALKSITRPLMGLAISAVSTVRTVLEMLASMYNFEIVCTDKIYFVPRGGAPVATITWDELGVTADGNNPPDPLPLTIANELEIPAQMALTYNNVDGDYQTDTQYSDRLLTGQESTSAVQVPMGFTAAEAKAIVDTLLLDKAVAALSTSISVDITRAGLVPTDVVLVVGEDGSTYRLRITKRTDAGGVTTLALVADDASVLVQAGVTSGGTASQTTVLPVATTTLALLDIPLLRDADDKPGLYVAVTGNAANWAGCAIYESLDDVTYTQVTTLADQTAIGTCTTVLGDWTGGNVFDESNTVTVNVGTIQQLSSASRDDVLANPAVNAALIGSELVQYLRATLVSTGVYTLSGLLRGRRGTEWASTGHTSGERFVALGSSGLRYLSLQSSDLGRIRFYKGVSAGQKLSDVTAQVITPSGVALECLSPVNARADRAAADTVLTWTRRTRLSTRLTGSLPINTPLGEVAEAYEVEVWDSTYTTLKRTLSATSPAATYTSAQQVADFGAAQSVLYLKIYQISATVARGHPLKVSI